MQNFTLSTKIEIDFLPRRLHWSPDYTCLITTSYSNNLQILDFQNTNEINVKLDKKFPTTVTNCCWYPLMKVSEAASCCFACVCPFNPIFLIDSISGRIRSSYRCQFNGDRPASLTTVCFNGASILAGGTRNLYECDIQRSDRLGEPAIECPGSVMSISPHPTSACIAVGVSTGDIVFIDSRNYQVLENEKFHLHSIDQIEWYGDFFVFSSARLENEVIGIDTRMPAVPSIVVETNRKSSRPVSLSIGDDLLFVGNENSEALVFDLKNEAKLIGKVGDEETPYAVYNKVLKKVVAASGKHVIVENEEEDEIDVTYEPKLKTFGVYG
ncbi:hypothetical protein TRFO_29453 [Tritrichomonas foetus]|uniref:Anaphase-promoting complex subunit 4 WD40 domain-containing protein n=1 Tax=Tritrichomonas foetus TaxID=1144522 RepID=A0A1J4JX55_9EUKA|nr:hypothetical protein TRFO_29453 [Tritrichomonas foetus]|eukprot:OHT03250.1 hypothetical protein TRFO_29453 [Tritrichomonas foetus]